MLKNLKEKFENGFSKKKIISIAIFAVAIITTIIAIVVNQSSEQSSKRKSTVIDSELARAMTYDQFEEGDDAVEGTDNVKFSAFFLRDVNNDGNAEKIKGTSKQIGKEDTLYMEVNVQTDGILKNAKIEIDGKNFYLATTAPKDNELKDNYIGTNIKKLEFNDMANGTQKLITGAVRSGDYSYSSSKASAIGSNINNLSRNDNKIIFTGTYVSSDGKEVQINKEINLQTDWYGTTSANISASTSTYYDLKDRQNETDGTITLTAGIRTDETDYQLNVNRNYLEGTIPQLNGYSPISVTPETSVDSFSYDTETRKFTLTRETSVNELGDITKSISRDNYNSLKIVYPLEAYRTQGREVVTIEVPVMTYYEGFNNPNTEFTNPYKSNEAKAILTYTFREDREYGTTLDIKVGEYMTSPTYRYVVSRKKPIKIYNEISSEEEDDNYTVEWYVSKGSNESNEGIIMKESKNDEEKASDNFIKVDATRDSMENITTNIGIGFGNADKFLNSDGFIKVYDDETDELLVTFTKADWGKYTKISPYKFNIPVKHIRVETSQTQDLEYLYVYSQKQLDDEYITTNYTQEQFEDLKYIESHLNVYAGTRLLGTLSNSASYEAPYSIANLSLSKNTLSTQVTEKNEILTIQAVANESANQVGWTNGSFLIKLPVNIISTEINNVEINNSDVSVISSEYLENNNGKFIKINTKNLTNTAQVFEIKIDTNITSDPRIGTTTENFELWASNEEGTDYYYSESDIYDVNDNLNISEKVHKSTTAVSLVAPNSLLTNQTASQFDNEGTQVISPQIADVKPQLATVSQEISEKTVRIGAQIKNNYSSTITDVVMLGKIPFEGNTYVLSGEDLKSEFTTKMTEKGIEIPEELQGKVVVYYSENETPDKDLTKEENGWKTAENITNWDNVKTYLIDFKSFEIASGAEYTFYYTIKIPNEVEYNQKSFSHHGVYFSLKTTEGKYKTQTEPNKLGIRIAEKYNLELQKYQTGKTNLVPGATYKITKEASDTEEAESQTAVTNAEGKLELQNLYAKRTYAIEEIKVPEDYELNTDVVKIIGTIQEDGSLKIDKTQGTTRDEIEVTKEEQKPYKVTIKVEDEAKAKLKITKFEKDAEVLVSGVRYKLTGAGLSENGKNVTTNANGEITLRGLKVGEEYTLEETKAEGYYLASPIKFVISNKDGTYSINVSEGTVKESIITEEDNIPTANIKLEDEKIPTYNLEIIKIQRITSAELTENKLEQALASVDTVYLADAKFKLYKGTKELGTYVTDASGKITLNDLYQYIDGKNEEGIYTLKETLAPEGYSKVKDIVFKVDGSTGELKFVNTEGKDESYTVENNIVRLLVEDSPSFKLIKKDAETKEVLANIKFAIYNIDNDTTSPAQNSKGEIIGTKESINGKEYYVVTTDSEGEITADLPEGMYKAVELEAPEKYDISDSTYYFGIGASREGKEGIKATWSQGIGGEQDDRINNVIGTSDGGYIVCGQFCSSTIELENGTKFTKKSTTSDSDGFVIKYNQSGEIEWSKEIGGDDIDRINSIAECNDGGYIAVGEFSSSTLDLGNGISLTNEGELDGMMIKLNGDGEIEWAKTISGNDADLIESVSITTDGGYVVGGYFLSKNIDLGNNITLANKGLINGMVVKYNQDGTAQWAKAVNGTGSNNIQTVSATKDGGCVAGGSFSSTSIDLGNGRTLNNNGNANAVLIKFNSNGEIEFAKGIGGTANDYIASVAGTSDGGYVIGGWITSSSIELDTGITLSNNGSSNGIIAKYNQEGKVEWAKIIGDEKSESIESVIETTSGEYVAIGSFRTSKLDLENDISISSLNEKNATGMIIKYSKTGETISAKAIGGTEDDCIYSVAETCDGAYIIGGKYNSRSIDLENEINLINKGPEYSADAMVVKLEKTELSKPIVIQTQEIGGASDDRINSISATKDGGYVVGGYFQSNKIDLGNNISLINQGTTSLTDGMIVKYSSSGEVEWAHEIGGDGYDEVLSVSATNDGGCIVGGHFLSESINLGNGISLTNKNNFYPDGMLIKYNQEGNVEWAKEIGDKNSECINTVVQSSDGGYIVGGYFDSSSIEFGNGINITNKGEIDGMVIKYSSNGEVEWAEEIGGDSEDYINSVAESSDGGYVVGGYFKSSTIDLGSGAILSNNGDRDGMIIKYNQNGKVEWARTIGGTDNDYITSIAECSDGGYIVGGVASSYINLENEVSIANKGDEDGFIIKFKPNGEAQWAKVIGGSLSERIKSVAECSDGGYLAGGAFGSSSIDLENGVNLTKTGSDAGMIIKYSQTGETEWAKSISGDGTEGINSVAETVSQNYIGGGFFYSSTIESDGKTLTNKGAGDGMVVNINSQKGVSVIEELEIENNRKEFKITTDINEIDNVKGGSISGEGEVAYEKVKYGDTSNKEIKMVPDENYELIAITVNGESYPFTVDEDGTFTMPAFSGVTADINVVATYALKDNKITINKVDKDTKEKLTGASFKLDQIEEAGVDTLYHTTVETNADGQAITQIPFGKYSITETKAPEGYILNETPTIIEFRSTEGAVHEFTIENEKKSKLIVHHYIKGTTNKLAEDEIYEGKAGERYTTNPKLDFERYELEKNENDEYILPENATGTYKTGTTEITYYYVEKKIPLTVHHYIEGTTMKVPLKAGGTAEDQVDSQAEGEKYTTSPISNDELSDEYELVETPSNANGEYTWKEVIVTYYYRKIVREVNLVKYQQDGVTPLPGARFKIDNQVYETDENGKIKVYLNSGKYEITEIEAPEGYKLPENPTVEITITRDIPETINVINEKKTGTVTVHHYIEGTTTKVPMADGTTAEDEIKTGSVGDIYVTSSKQGISDSYKVVAEPENSSGIYVDGNIEVTYYYGLKNSSVNIRYLEKGTNIELAESDTLVGKINDAYTTVAKNIEGYKLVGSTENTIGNFEAKPITVIYYYSYKTKGTVQYIDKTTGEIIEQLTTEGLEGEDFVTESKDFPNYVLVEEPAEKTVKMTKEEKILKYYYIHISGGVVEKHIDVISGQVLANAVHEGNEGDEYDISSRTFAGYDLVESRLPTNSKGTMKVDSIEVIYYYIYRSKVTTEYIDKNTGNKLADDETQNGHEGDNYKTEEKAFDDYKLAEVPANANGTMTKDDIKVTYYYVHISNGVIVNHIDIKTSGKLLDETKIDGYEGDVYETHEENIPGYDLVKEEYPENAKGIMTIEETSVTYYYIRKTQVNVRYVDIETGEEIENSSNIQGHQDDEYKTEPKSIQGYDLAEEPANKTGTMTTDPIDVIYYYKKVARVVINYYDIDTKEKIADEIEIKGYKNDEYTSEEKDIKYYKLEKVPENKDGKMQVTITKDENGNKIVEDTIYVNYYYKKFVFNLKVDKTIASVIVNGQETAINGKLGKVEVHRKELATANVKVVYKIKVTNDSELIGKANIIESIPSGMTMVAENNAGWSINQTTASLETDDIKPGESREYQVVLGWQNNDSNVGTKENVASIITENEAGFEEKDLSDNESKASVIVAVETGETEHIVIALGILMIMIAITAGVYRIKKN